MKTINGRKIAFNLNKELKDKPSRDTPALAKANKGIIPKATQGLIACSTLINKEKSFSFFL